MTTTPKPTAHTSASEDFVYHPPDCARSARQILIKPNIGYPVGPPATVSMAVLGKVIQGLKQANPDVKILIVEGVCSKTSFATIMAKSGVHSLLTEGVELLDADALEVVEYPNRSPKPIRFSSMWAPRLLQEVDCCFSVSAFKRTQLKGEPLISASLKKPVRIISQGQVQSPQQQLPRATPSAIGAPGAAGCVQHHWSLFLRARWWTALKSSSATTGNPTGERQFPSVR